MRHPRASPAPARARCPEGCPRGQALWNRRRAWLERGSRPRAPSPTQALRCEGHGRNPYRARRRLPARRKGDAMKFRAASLQMRLAVRLAALYVVATALAIAVLVYEAYDTAGTLNNRDLHLRRSLRANKR